MTVVKYFGLYLTVNFFALSSKLDARHLVLISSVDNYLLFKLVFRQCFWELKLVVVDCFLCDV
jgi:hypothetical protein